MPPAQIGSSGTTLPAPTTGQPSQNSSPQALRLLKLREVARLLSVSTVTVRRRVKDGTLPAISVKGRLYFQPHEIKIFLMKNAVVLWMPSDA